ncbi:uncharacterized protein FSUBG_2475 [Fusarium subglutinans]|uniref:Uncharacterized protein n=1 Tax=Gibberella subglutinans TaxID=42677 RepID=A0A8H5QC29_GIBSU|nr:uncharacterized protein FSUBG_2475 [Fusarium subglutinans]KAF5611196.1 hypothetical protein FSUBG_2475 [Fusarium subglutinans]
MAIFASSAVRLLIGLTVALTFIAFFTPTGYVPDVALSFRMPAALKKLEVSITQEEKDPVLIRATVRNNNDEPVTILSYGSPLDPLGISLGILYITPKGDSKPLDIMQIEASRLWPPADDALIEILPGRSAIWEFTLQEPVVPMDRVFEGATVQLKGTWNAVWTKEKKNVDYTSFEEGTPANETLTGPFKSNVIDIEVV